MRAPGPGDCSPPPTDRVTTTPSVPHADAPPPRPPSKRKRRRDALNTQVAMRRYAQTVRGEVVLAQKLAGRTMREIAQDLHVHTQTAHRALSLARRNNFWELSRDTLLALIPKALKVYDAALDEGDHDIATKVLEANGLLPKHHAVSLAGAPQQSPESYEVWRERILTKYPQPSPATGGEGDHPSVVVETLATPLESDSNDGDPDAAHPLVALLTTGTDNGDPSR